MHRLFLSYSIAKLKQYEARINACLDRMEYQQVWDRGSENENAVGNLVLHLCGNVRQWLISGVGGHPDERQRDLEFSVRESVSIPELKLRLHETVVEAAQILEHLPEERLTAPFHCQGYDMSTVEAIYHVVEHFAYHAGQIIFATKMLTREDLGFYKHLNKAGHSEQTP